MSYERLSNLPRGYKQRRLTVNSATPSASQHLAARRCAGCGEPLGLDRAFVKYYKLYHLECWQTKFPERAAADRKTRGED